MQRKFIIFLVLQVTLQTSCVRSQCDVSNQDCIQLFRKFQEALFNNTNNLFVLQSVFYPPTQITPVLVKVIYKLNTNIFCQGREIVDCHIYQPTVCDANGSYTFGWTNRGIYKIFHASIINQLRFQLPFLVLQISEDIHNLTEEYDVDAFLWDGEMQLPSVNLSLTVDLPINEYDCICDPLKYPIEPALGELTEWLKAYAKVAQGEDYKMASSEDKAIALQCTAVKNYGRFSAADRDSDARFGRIILLYTYAIGFAITILTTPFVMGVLFMILNSFQDTDNQDEEKANKRYYYKLMFAAASAVSLFYSFTAVFAALYQALKLYTGRFASLNEFQTCKIGCLSFLMGWVIFTAIVLAVLFPYKPSANYNTIKKILAFFAILSLTFLAAYIMLSFFPTILLLFAYPINSSALLALHIALFYSATVVLAVYFAVVHYWIKEHDSMISKKHDPMNMLEKIVNKLKQNECESLVVHVGWFLCITLGLLITCLLPLTYVCIILLYQFVVARSNTNDVALNGITMYVPTLIIGAFGFIIDKGAIRKFS